MELHNLFEGITPQDVERYTEYWMSLVPKTDEDICRRWLFAYLSIHSTWESNVRGYELLKDLNWLQDKNDLHQRLVQARSGLHNMRTENIWHFNQMYWNDPSFFRKHNDETWLETRDRIVPKMKGMGISKVSFTLEMCYPDTELVCLDIHMLQLYGYNDRLKFTEKKGRNIYLQTEADWVQRASEINAHPYIARCLYWDHKQQKSDSRYWSYVLEA